MTTQEFKKDYPHYSHLEGNELWDKMTEAKLRHQEADKILKPIIPFWKRYVLRWLFYRVSANMSFMNPRWHKFSSDKRCKACKKGVNLRIGFMMMLKDGSSKYYSQCPHCHQEYIQEPNKNISHKLWKAGLFTINLFWQLLDLLHLVRNTHARRYDMFGDESMYVQTWEYNFDTGKTKVILKPRKWFEYIFIQKSFHA